MDEKYDSAADTMRHRRRVKELIEQITKRLAVRALNHDVSKLVSPEKEILDEVTPKLAQIEYGSSAYYEQLGVMRPALEHHYANNRHHPEHHERGVSGMSLVDLVEMLADWMAASERHAEGSLDFSLRLNASRFTTISDQLLNVLWNTARDLGWLRNSECGVPHTTPDGTRMICNVNIDEDGTHVGPHQDGNYDGGLITWDDKGIAFPMSDPNDAGAV